MPAGIWGEACRVYHCLAAIPPAGLVELADHAPCRRGARVGYSNRFAGLILIRT